MSASKEYMISQSFITKYYDVFARNPGELYKFYKEDSAFVHSDGVQINEDVVYGVENILERVNQLNLAGARVDLSEGSVDAQRSENNGVFLTVTGHVTLLSKPTRPFVQSFFLAAQNSSNQKTVSYFVLNSVFRLLGAPFTEGEMATAANVGASPAAEQSTDDILDVPSYMDGGGASFKDADEPLYDEAVVEEEILQEHDVEVDVEEDIMDSRETDLVNGEEVKEDFPEEQVVYEEPEFVSSPIIAAVVTESSEPPSPSPPKSFADVVKRLAGEKAASALPPQAPKGRVAVNRKEKGGREDTPETTHAAPSAPPSLPARQPVALYVNQLVPDTTQEDLIELFSRYGDVKNVDVHRGYAFVEFVDENVAKTVITLANEEAFTVRGQAVKIEERQTRTKGRDKGPSRDDRQSGPRGDRGHESRGGGGGGGDGRRQGDGSRDRARKEGGGGGGRGRGGRNPDSTGGGTGTANRDHDRDGNRQSQKSNTKK